MTLVRFNNRPFHLGNLIREIENRFEPVQKQQGVKTPAVNILEDENGYYIELPAPGRSKEEFSLSVDQELLTISYEAPQAKATSDKKILRNEYSLQSFSRSFSLDQSIESEQIEATYVNGMLNIFLPKKKTAEPAQKKIQVQ